jgi:hypothetical protein
VEHISEEPVTTLKSLKLPPHIKNLIIDADVFTTEQALQLFEDSDHKISMARFSAKTGKLITEGEVFY